MGRKSFKKNQKLYKMKGCSKNKSRRRLGGGLNSAYTGADIKTQSNPFLAYTGKGGGEGDNINIPPAEDVRNPNLPSNPYGANPALPNTGPVPLNNPNIPTNMGSIAYGGSRNKKCGKCGKYCKCGCQNVMRGGNCGGTCPMSMTGGSCGCGAVTGGKKRQKGGSTIDPQGLVGSPWTSSPATWPGVDGIDGNRNYLAYNEYKVDPQTALISVGANRPFLFGGKKLSKGGKKLSKGGKKFSKGGKKLSKGGKKKCFTKRRQRGGALSNFLTQDFVNLGRQIQYGIGSTYNGLNGYPAPTPVLPWQGQLPRTPNLYTVRGAAL